VNFELKFLNIFIYRTLQKALLFILHYYKFRILQVLILYVNVYFFVIKKFKFVIT